MRTEKQKRLLRATLEHIEADILHWDQRTWRDAIDSEKPMTRCNTAMCFAGWAVTIDGCRWGGPVALIARRWGGPVALIARKDDDQDCVYDGVITVADRARRVLGLSVKEADSLFYSKNSIADLRRLVKKFTQ